MFLSLGFMGGMVRKSIDVSKMTTDNQYGPGGFDPSAPTGENFVAPNFTSWDANVGMSFNTSFGKEQQNSMFVGAAYHHLNRPKNSFYRNPDIELNPKYVFSTGVKLKIDDFSSFTIHADHSSQGSFPKQSEVRCIRIYLEMTPLTHHIPYTWGLFYGSRMLSFLY